MKRNPRPFIIFVKKFLPHQFPKEHINFGWQFVILTKSKTVMQIERHADADLKISLYICGHLKTIPRKCSFLNPKSSRITCP